jgi:type IV secretion system protein VirB10
MGSNATEPEADRAADGLQEGRFVRGERGWPSVAQTRSLQSRMHSILACGLMIVLGLGVLGWYYSGAYSRQARAEQSQRAAAAARAQGDAPLPAIGRIEPPPPVVADRPGGSARPSEAESAAIPPVPSAADAASVLPLSSSLPVTVQAQGQPVGAAVKTRAQLAAERRLGGAAFVRSDAGRGGAAVDLQNNAGLTDTTTHDRGPLAQLLQPDVIATAHASLLPATRLLLPKGAFIDCTLETAIDSTLPGMTTCITANDTFGADGDVVLLERGSKLVGETRGQVQQGAARVFVLWTEARTPNGIVIPLNSPATDELGRSGLGGEVDRHFWQRFGAAMLITTLDGAVQAAVQSSSRGSGPVIYDPSSSAAVMTDVLKGTLSIPPTVIKHNGDRIQALVARDLDFRTVYELRHAAVAGQ